MHAPIQSPQTSPILVWDYRAMHSEQGKRTQILGNSSIRLYDLYSFGVCCLFVFFPLVFFFPQRGFLREVFPLGMLATCPK